MRPLRARKWGVLLASIWLGIVAVGSVVAAQAGGRVEVSSAELGAGSSTDVTVALVESGPIDAFEIALSFDPTVVRVEDLQLAAGWSSPRGGLRVDRAGTIFVSGFSTEAKCVEDSVCQLATFRVAGVQAGESIIEVESVGLLREGEAVPGVASESGTITVAGGPGPAGDEDPTADPATGDGGGVIGDPAPSDGERDLPPQASGSGSNLGIFLVAALVVLIVVAPFVGARWIGSRATPAPGAKADRPTPPVSETTDLDAFFDRVAQLGEISADPGPEPGRREDTTNGRSG